LTRVWILFSDLTSRSSISDVCCRVSRALTRLPTHDDGLAVVGHQADERRVPLVDDLGEGRRARGHEDLPDAVPARRQSHIVQQRRDGLEVLDALVGHAEEGLGGTLLGLLVDEVPDAVAEGEALGGADLGQDADLKVRHRVEQLRVVLGVDADHRVVPLDRRERARQPVLEVPVHGPAEVDVVLDEAHPAVARPALLVVCAVSDSDRKSDAL